MPPVVDYWRAQGHTVTTDINWGAEETHGFDVVYFYAVENNLRVASREDNKAPNTRIVVEAVDIDIYAGLGGVNWDYVDVLIFMAHHKKELGMRKGGPKNTPTYIVPGGVDLDTWTYRRDPSRGYNVAWIGRLWIGKGVFNAIQVFNQLVKTDPDNPWKLYIRGDEYLKPEWWKDHVEAYITANDRLKGRIEFVPWQGDLNGWLESMSYYLMTSFKEAFSYTSAQCAAKGIKTLIQMTNGMDQVWPSSWIFQTHDEAVQMFLGSYEPETYRSYIADQYPLSRRLAMLDGICGL